MTQLITHYKHRGTQKSLQTANKRHLSQLGPILMPAMTAVPSKCRVMSPAKSPAIVVSLPAMLTGAGIKERWHCRPFRVL
jgi:hypothetical protein